MENKQLTLALPYIPPVLPSILVTYIVACRGRLSEGTSSSYNPASSAAALHSCCPLEQMHCIIYNLLCLTLICSNINNKIDPCFRPSFPLNPIPHCSEGRPLKIQKTQSQFINCISYVTLMPQQWQQLLF